MDRRSFFKGCLGVLGGAFSLKSPVWGKAIAPPRRVIHKGRSLGPIVEDWAVSVLDLPSPVVKFIETEGRFFAVCEDCVMEIYQDEENGPLSSKCVSYLRTYRPVSAGAMEDIPKDEYGWWWVSGVREVEKYE
jgi:hypothetical protein